MIRSRCKFASLVNGPDGRRDCALGLHGGRVDKLGACQSCTSWQLLEAPPAPDRAGPTSVVRPLVTLPVLAKCAHLGGKVPGEPCGSQLMRCDLHRDVTTRLTPCAGADRCCATCGDNTALRNRAAPAAGSG